MTAIAGPSESATRTEGDFGALLNMRRFDPARWVKRVPTEADYRDFRAWALGTYGVNLWAKYQTRWDERRV